MIRQRSCFGEDVWIFYQSLSSPSAISLSMSIFPRQQDIPIVIASSGLSRGAKVRTDMYWGSWCVTLLSFVEGSAVGICFSMYHPVLGSAARR